jgi:glutathione-specific gamma-glutamylcyclotransferase
MTPLSPASTDELLHRIRSQWRGQGGDLWVFGYASLIWRPEFEFSERRAAKVNGWHRALHMWSTLNRGTPQCPGLVFALLSGGSCQGVVFRIPAREAEKALYDLWQREMPGDVYQPRWLACHTAEGSVQALAFTLPRRHPSFCGHLSSAQYQQIFSQSCGRYGTTLDYAQRTYDSLLAEGIHDRSLEKLLQLHVRK